MIRGLCVINCVLVEYVLLWCVLYVFGVMLIGICVWPVFVVSCDVLYVMSQHGWCLVCVTLR